MPRVFISYSHDSKEHVADLTARLRGSGVQVTIDSDTLPGGPIEGWEIWSEAQVKEADHVLIACTETYCRRYESKEAPGIGLGAVWEARAIRGLLYGAGGINEKFRVVIFDDVDTQSVPLSLSTYQRFAVYRDEDYRALVAWLGGSAAAASTQMVRWPASDAPYVWGLADRKEVSIVFEEMAAGTSTKRILLVSGSSNRGKTALVEELLSYAGRFRVTSARVDLKGCPSLDDVFETMKLDLGPHILSGAWSAKGTTRLYALMGDLQKLTAPLLLVFDTYEQATDETRKFVETQLLPRIHRAPGLIVVISGQKVPERGAPSWWQFTERKELEPISKPSDWLDYAHKKWGSGCVLPSDVEVLARATGGDPGQLSALIENFVRHQAGKEA